MQILTGRVRPKVKPDGSTVFVADYKDPKTGKRKQREAGSEAAAKALIDQAYGRAPAGSQAPCEGFPLGAALEALQRRAEGLSPQSQKNLRAYSRDLLRFFGENTAIEAITFHMVEEWMRHLRLRVKNKPATVREKWKVLKQARQYALDSGAAKELGPYPPSPPVQNTKERVFSDEERQAYLEHLAEHHPRSGQLLELMFETCSRYAQINRLTPRWVRVDCADEDATLTFPAEIEKNKRPRTIPLTSRAAELLRELVKGKGKDELIFGIPYNTYGDHLRQTRSALGIADDQLTGHCARHTAATRLAEANVNQALLMRYGGWHSLSAVARYMHASTESLKAARNALG